MQDTPSASLLIDGNTELIAHIGYPTHAFKAPLIYNPYFAAAGIPAVVVPMGCQAPHYPALLQSLFALTNMRGALITMPHKVATVALLDEASTAVQIAGACNAVRRSAEGKLQGDLFDGEGFVRGLLRKGLKLQGARALVVGCGGVGSAIAASLAGAGVAALTLFDVQASTAQGLAQRLRSHYPQLQVSTGERDPQDMDLVVNATPMGMHDGDELPLDVTRLSPHTFVGEVVMYRHTTAFLAAALERGCSVQVGTDMLFEQIPAYLEFFGLPSPGVERLRELAQIPT